MLINELGEVIDLNRSWQFAFDEPAEWGPIRVPECWESQGRSKFKEGPAYYRCSVAIPDHWANQHIQLECGAASYACRIFCNGVEVGHHFGMWTPFTIDLSAAVSPGNENLLELEVYKPGERYPTRSSLAGFLPDVATTFGGIWQPIYLRAATCALSGVMVQTEFDSRSVKIRAQAETFGSAIINPYWNITILQDGFQLREDAILFTPDGLLDVTIVFPEAIPWSPDKPALYDVQITLYSGGQPTAQVIRRIGFRKLSEVGAQLCLNDRPFMVRGILSWGWEPDRIAPVYTPEQARNELRKVREMGFNLVKLCLVIPSPAYFDVADEEGMLLWVEFPMWLPEVNDWLREQAPKEYAEITQMLSHHPSVVLYSLGCELNQSVNDALMVQMNQAVRRNVQDVLVCDNSGSGESYGGLDFDFSDFTDYHPYYDLQFFEPLLDNWRRDWQSNRPWIFGEFCDSDTFRDLTEIIQANGGRRPWWLTQENPVTTWRSEPQAVLEWEKRLETANLKISLQDLVQISYQQSFIIRKYTLETLRRRNGMGGYVVTGLRDTPISTSGIWDDFGRPKWPAGAFARINSEAILMVDVVRRRQWRYGGDRPDRVDPYNYWSGKPACWYVILHDTGAGFPMGSRLDWTLSGLDGVCFASDSESLDQPCLAGVPQQVGIIQVPLPEVSQPTQLRLEVQFTNGQRIVENEWPVWVYPEQCLLPSNLAIFDPTGILGDFSDDLKTTVRFAPEQAMNDPQILIATSLDKQVWWAIENGARVLLLQQGEDPLPARHCPFWREGIKLFTEHLFWDRFPHQGFSDLQFFGLASDLAFDTTRLIEALPQEAVFQPLLRRLDAREFHMSEYLFEAQVGKGLLIGCTLRLQGGTGAQPFGFHRNVAGAALFNALLDYLENNSHKQSKEDHP
jgi:hypothetical protein